MDWQVVSVAVAGIVGQYFKTWKNLPTWVPQTALLVIGFCSYVAYNPPKEDGWALVRYLLEALVAGASANGIASIVGLHPALKTDSR